MAQHLSEQSLLPQQLSQTLGYSLPQTDLQHCLSQVKFITPKVGKFWQANNAEPGIYIILTGKVRLLDNLDELLSTLERNASFGESTLFAEFQHQDYIARAALSLQLCLIPGAVIAPLLRKYPQIRQHLWQKASRYQTPQPSLSRVDAVRETPPTQSATATSFSKETSPKPQPKINKAYFPTTSQKVGHLLQKVTRRYPFYAQQSASDCGAACLVMVSRHWGKRFSINRLRDIANVDRNGTSLRGLSAAAESLGFSSRPVKAGLKQLAKQQLPAIAHWEGKHYIVVYAITAKHVIVADPAIGQRTLTHAEFQAKWTGYTLLLEPTYFFKETAEASTNFWQFFELMKPHSLVILEVFLASIFIQIFGLITPLFTQLIESERIIQKNLNAILQGRTTFVIAHRLSTIRQADLILVLDQGRLIESGTHEELMAKKTHYFYLNQQQLEVS